MGQMGQVQIGRCGWGAWEKVLMGQMGGADGGMLMQWMGKMQMGTDADGADDGMQIGLIGGC